MFVYPFEPWWRPLKSKFVTFWIKVATFWIVFQEIYKIGLASRCNAMETSIISNYRCTSVIFLKRRNYSAKKLLPLIHLLHFPSLTANFCFTRDADQAHSFNVKSLDTHLRPGVLVLCQPAGVFEQQNFVILEAVNVERPEQLTQPRWKRRQSLRKK